VKRCAHSVGFEPFASCWIGPLSRGFPPSRPSRIAPYRPVSPSFLDEILDDRCRPKG
jgi:hypothetical protein